MRCSSFCVANSINLNILTEKLIEKGLEPKYFDDVIYVQKSIKDNSYIDVFYFAFGSIVVWGAEEYDAKLIVDECVEFSEAIEEQPASDLIYYRIDNDADRTRIDEEINQIVLHEDNSFIKLSISHALAQSVKLNILEASVSKLIEKNQPIQQELSKTGSISLSKKELSKKIGTLFNERYSINLHSDILDTPEFFWRRPSYEPLYLMTAAFQDIQVRQNILNHRLDLIHELYTILSNELNYKHSTRLEIIVIILIAIEVLIASHHNGIFTQIFNWLLK